MQKAPSRNPAPLFSPIFSGKTEKIGPPEASAVANSRQPLSLGCAEPAPLEGEPFPLRRGINLSGASRQLPWEGPFSAAFSSASCRKPSRRAAGRKNRPPGPHICPQHAHVLHAAEQKTRNCAHCRRLRPRRRVFCVIFNVLSIKSLNFAGNNAKNFIF